MSDVVFALQDPLPFARLCAQEQSYSLKVPKTLLPRLAEACEEIAGDADLKITFKRDLQGLNVVEGEVAIEVQLICQRCFKPFVKKLHASFSSTPDKEKAESLRIADKLDLIELSPDGSFEVLPYLEDCLLLELPLIFEHENEEDCDLKGEEWVYGEEEVPAADNPFAALEALKDSLKS